MPFTISRRIRLVPAVASVSVCIATAAISDINSGAYLAARQAGLEGNYRSASEYFYNTLIADPSNLGILEQTMTSFLGTGQVESAAELGWNLIEEGGESQIANMAIMAQSVKMGDWGAVFDQLEAGHEVGPLLDGIVQSWAYIAQGNNRRGLESFDELIDTPGLRPFGLKHKAVALTLMGDLEGADAIYALPLETGFEPTRASVMAHLQVLCALGEYERASALLTDVFGADAGEEVTLIREAIAAEGVPYLNSYITTPVEAVAQAFQDLAEVLQDEANASYLLLYTQAARYIAPQDASAHIAAARLLNDLEQYSEAAEIFAQVHPKDPAFQSAEMGPRRQPAAGGRTRPRG